MTFPQRFTGKTDLVTGAGTGCGAEVAVRAAQEGADVAVHYRSSADGASSPIRTTRATSRRATVTSSIDRRAAGSWTGAVRTATGSRSRDIAHQASSGERRGSSRP